MGFRAGGLLGRNGFGYLSPRRERHWRGEVTPSPSSSGDDLGGGNGVLGMTWDSEVFPSQAADLAAAVHAGWVAPQRDATSGAWLPHTLRGTRADGGWPNETRVAVMMGGALSPWVGQPGAQPALVSTALRALREHTGITATPDAMHVSVAAGAIPQYTLGHGDRVAAIRAGLEALYGAGAVTPLGNSFGGIGVADTVAGALGAAEDLAGRLAGHWAGASPLAASGGLR